MGYRKLFQDHKDGEYNNILTIPKVRISKFWPNKSEEFYKNIPKLWEITKNYSLSECYSLEHFFKAMTTVCSCSNIYLGLIFRHHLKLINQKAGIFLIYTPSILASVKKNNLFLFLIFKRNFFSFREFSILATTRLIFSIQC